MYVKNYIVKCRKRGLFWAIILGYLRYGEKNKMDKNEQMAKSILKAVGGTENIKAATHCMTRLRLSLKDDKIPVDDEIKKFK